MRLFLFGACTLASLMAGLFFLRFWRDTRDRFFLYFAVAFWLGGVAWAMLGLTTISTEAEPYIYLIRLLSFLIILAAIVDKNRKKPAVVPPRKKHTGIQSERPQNPSQPLQQHPSTEW